MSPSTRYLGWLCALALASSTGLVNAASSVDINTATADQLVEALTGVGHSKAEAIVAWRQAHGPFKSLTDLEQVKGIGPALIQRNRDAIHMGTRTTEGHKTRAKSRSKATHATDTP